MAGLELILLRTIPSISWGVLFVAALVIRAILFGVYIGAADF